MRLHAMREILGISVAVLVAWGAPAQSFAQAETVLDDEEPAASDEPKPAAADATATAEAANKVQYGVALRLRNVRLPASLLEVFVEKVPGGISSFGYGLEFVRKRGEFEISVGIEHESLNGKDGLWLDKGDTIPQDEVDLVQYDNFAWTSADVTFVWHTPVHKMVAIRYGAGVGLALIHGQVLRTDYICQDGDLVQGPQDCIQKPGAEHIRDPEDKIPPVFPILNLLVGAQVRPMDKLEINLEFGFRSLPYFGTTVSYFF
jgi:hypothetical protein